MATLTKSLTEGTATSGLETHTTSPTFRLFINFVPLGDCSRPPGDAAGGGPSPAGSGPSPAGGLPSPAGDGQSPAGDFHKHTRIDHVYTRGLISELKMMPDSTMDHRPVVTTVRAWSRSHSPGTKLVSLKRQNFKAITREVLERALSISDWTRVYAIKDVDDILEYITDRIISDLTIVAPEREIHMNKGPKLYLTQETLQAMKNPHAATGRRYRDLHNEVSRLVRRVKQDSNLLSLKKASNDPKVLWHLADQALKKDRPSLLPFITGANSPTMTPMEAAEVINQFFIDKVEDLCKKALLPITGVPETPDVAGEVPRVRRPSPAGCGPRRAGGQQRPAGGRQRHHVRRPRPPHPLQF
jgi:hypothetical protein